ncbi:MAG: cation-transporting P-type ATPase, partial [Defluviitaleaceae bacterium]|nr:cation-transporting P-type ATPase [Defluviitaleaceae bacterium]
MKFYYTQVDDVLENLKSGRDGLSTAEVQERLQARGQGKQPEHNRQPQFERFAEQFAKPQVIILLAAATFGVAFGGELIDAGIILLLVAMGAAIGLACMTQTAAALDKLAKLHSRISKAVRDGNIVSVRNSEIVPGDIVMLETGVYIPADGRIIDETDLIIDETSATGVQDPARKSADALVLRETDVMP